MPATTTPIVMTCQPRIAAGGWPIEIVERKGLGHPDTICDCLSEKLSVALCRYYVDHFGLVLHHNVDKALLAAGRSEPAFGGGRIIEPFDLYLSGRATAEVGGKRVPIAELAGAVVARWFRDHMHAFDSSVGLRLHTIVRPGSPELVDLFNRQRDARSFLANDTSCGVGFAPLTELERLVLELEHRLNEPGFKARFPETGEDIKIMGLRERDRISLTISCAFIGRFLGDLRGYFAAKEKLQASVLEIARTITGRDIAVRVNAADGATAGAVYLTVSGTSAEAGDDGETGRGNRINGLITPCRPMTLEATAGKNPITHVGKLYNAAANAIATALVTRIPGLNGAECYLVSEIGRPVDKPRVIHLRLSHEEGQLTRDLEASVDEVVEEEVALIPELWRSFMAEALGVA